MEGAWSESDEEQLVAKTRRDVKRRLELQYGRGKGKCGTGGGETRRPELRARAGGEVGGGERSLDMDIEAGMAGAELMSWNGTDRELGSLGMDREGDSFGPSIILLNWAGPSKQAQHEYRWSS